MALIKGKRSEHLDTYMFAENGFPGKASIIAVVPNDLIEDEMPIHALSLEISLENYTVGQRYARGEFN